MLDLRLPVAQLSQTPDISGCIPTLEILNENDIEIAESTLVSNSPVIISHEVSNTNMTAFNDYLRLLFAFTPINTNRISNLLNQTIYNRENRRLLHFLKYRKYSADLAVVLIIINIIYMLINPFNLLFYGTVSVNLYLINGYKHISPVCVLIGNIMHCAAIIYVNIMFSTNVFNLINLGNNSNISKFLIVYLPILYISSIINIVFLLYTSYSICTLKFFYTKLSDRDLRIINSD